MYNTEKPLHASGAGSIQCVAYRIGYTQEFFPVYPSDSTRDNTLSLAELEDFYLVSFVPSASYISHLPECDVIFKRSSKHYIADWCDIHSAFELSFMRTIRNNLQPFLIDKDCAWLPYLLMQSWMQVVLKIDVKIRTQEYIYRSVKSVLLWSLPPNMALGTRLSSRCSLACQYHANHGF